MTNPRPSLSGAVLEPAFDHLADVLLTSAEVARRLRISESGLRVMRMKGRGPKFLKLDTGAVRYRCSDVLRYELEAASRGR
ncbi:MAG: helix-turn-helix domain-containing protein [Hyphomicrobium sp.]|jgi:hypothetical protein